MSAIGSHFIDSGLEKIVDSLASTQQRRLSNPEGSSRLVSPKQDGISPGYVRWDPVADSHEAVSALPHHPEAAETTQSLASPQSSLVARSKVAPHHHSSPSSSPPPPTVLLDIRDRLQRAILAGHQNFHIVEREEPLAEPYVASEAAKFKVLSKGDPDAISFASNTSTSLLLSRQFESLTRKDIMLEEYERFNELIYLCFQSARWKMQSNFTNRMREMAVKIEMLEKHEADMRSNMNMSILELENACRRRTEQCANECNAFLEKELRSAFSMLHQGRDHTQRNWLAHDEETERHTLVLESDRLFSRILTCQLSEMQGLIMSTIAREGKIVSSKTTGAFKESAEDLKEDKAADTLLLKQLQQHNEEVRSEILDREDHDECSQRDSSGSPAANQMHPAAEDSEVSSTHEGTQTYYNFTPYWGWMWKSTGVLTTWQKRFFVFTKRGKLKLSANDKGPWTVVVSAQHILRVETDAYYDTTNGVPPPVNPFQAYGFYIDAVDQRTSTKQTRLRFCCFNKEELNAWLVVLRKATDVVFSLEQTGSLQPSPLRKRIDPSMGSPVTYRKRTQIEDDMTALEEHEKKRTKEKKKPSASPEATVGIPLFKVGVSPVSSRFGKPPHPATQ